jgi:hypothetical protein
MIFARYPRTEVGSCNYCNKGKLNVTGQSLTYPYKEVILVKGNNISSVFCDECFDEIQNKKVDDIEFKVFLR